MWRVLAVLLLVLNLAVLLWGWIQDKPVEPPLPPLAQARGEILLRSEWAGRSAAVGGVNETLDPTELTPATPNGGLRSSTATGEMTPRAVPTQSPSGPSVAIPPMSENAPAASDTETD